MSAELPPVLPLPAPVPAAKRYAVTIKLLLVAVVVLLLHLPLNLINGLREERAENRTAASARAAETAPARDDSATVSRFRTERPPAPRPAGSVLGVSAVEGYRMVYRALKYSVLVLGLVFTAFFLFETLAGLRLHVIHYTLVGAALCLFYLALLALGEVVPPGWAYLGAAAASSLLIVGYSVAILRSYARATGIAALLASEHSVLYVVLRLEDYALLAGTATLFVVLGALMYFTRHVDWFAQETGRPARA